jgi:uncharacterized membrane protein YbhN (UPF0104 family)
VVERRPPPGPEGVQEPGWEWRPSIGRVFAEMRPAGLAAALVMLVVGSCFGTTRWWRILALAGCLSTWRNTFRLVYLGMFFNLVVPGLTGGDLVKTVLVVRENPERRPDALVSVVLDRLVGVWSLVALATGVIWALGGVVAPLRWPALAAFAAATAGMFLVMHPGPRRALGIDALLGRLPFGETLQKLERAAALFQGRPRELALAVLLSLGNHLCVVGAVYAIGRAFGDAQGYGSYVTVVSVANTISAIPLTPSGWGVGEQAFGALFDLLGSEFALGVAVSVTYRLCNLGLGLLGGVFLLLPGGRGLRDQVRNEGMDTRTAEASGTP